MSLFAIGDLHLHFQSELKAPGQLREPVWKNAGIQRGVFRVETITLKYGNTNSFFIPGEGVFEKGANEG